MSHDPILNSHVMNLLPKDMEDILVLDVAAGLGSWGYTLKTQCTGNPNIIAIDIWIPYIKRIDRINLYNEIMCTDARHLPFRNDCFNIVLACEILEHIPKHEGFEFLSELERIASNLIIVSTPLGYSYQGAVHNNVYEKHISVWLPNEFINCDYNVKILDPSPGPRTLKFVSDIRRWILRLPPPLKEILAYKYKKITKKKYFID